MQLKILLVICFVLVFSIVSSRNFPDNSKNHHEGSTENFVLIGESSSEKLKPKIEDDKNFRSGHYYSLIPMAIAHTKPSSDYYSMTPTHPNNHHNHHPHPSNGLVNIQLLEPFMLVTFLLFVLCLVDKAKLLPLPISRIDKDYHIYGEYENFVNAKRNQTEFLN